MGAAINGADCVAIFKDWRMGFRAIDVVDAEKHPGFAPFFANGFDAATIGARKGIVS